MTMIMLPPGARREDDSTRLFRLFAVIGRIDPELAARCLGFSADRVADLLLGCADLVEDDGVLRLAPDAAAAVLESAAAEELEESVSQVLDLVAARPGPGRDTLLHLVDLGCVDQRLTDAVLILDAEGAVEDAVITGRVHALGRRLGWNRHEVALSRAEALLAEDRFDRCLALCDQVIESGAETERGRAIGLSAMVEARLGNPVRALDLHRMQPPTDSDAIVAAVSTALACGQSADVTDFAARHDAAATSAGAWSGLFVQGLLGSLEGDGGRGVAALVRAGQAVRYATRSSRLLAHTPATLGAAAALGQGDPVVAASVLEQALTGDVGGRHGRQAHLLGLAWTAMITGDLTRATELADELDPADLRTPRHAVQLRVIRIGLARRQGDGPGLTAAWRLVRGDIPALPVDLFTLPLIGELHVAGARVGDPARLDDHMARGLELLAALGHPPVWSTQFHWSGVQAAILGRRPEMLRPHASALAAGTAQSDFARRLAEAGQAWLDALRDRVDPVAVTAAVISLSRAGLAWDASRLAGFAATRCADPAAAKELLRLARSVDRMRMQDEDDDANRVNAVLTEREMHVARLMLQGLGYREIGQRLFISPRTVEHHVARVRRRLGVGDRRELFERLRELLD